MNRSRVFEIIGQLACVAIAVWILLGFMNNVMCTPSETKRFGSPSGRVEIVLVDSGFGAWTGAIQELYLVPRGKPHQSGIGIMQVTETNTLRIFWEDDEHVKITLRGDVRVSQLISTPTAEIGGERVQITVLINQ